MIRLAAAALLLATSIVPLSIYPAAPVTWLVASAVLAGGAGVAVLAVWPVTLAGVLVLIAEAVALMIVQPPFDPVGAIALGAMLTLLLSVVHFAARVHGAALGPSVFAWPAREWLTAVALGIAAAAALTACGLALAGLARGASPPVVVAAAVLGTALAAAGAVALVAARRETGDGR